MSRLQNLKKIWLPFTKTRASLHASSTCFYIVLSVVPAFSLILSFLAKLSFTEDLWYEVLSQAVPKPILMWADQFLSAAKIQKISVISLSTALTLWSGSKGISALTQGLQEVLGMASEKRYFHRRFFSMIVFLWFLLLWIILSVGVIFGNELLRLLFPGIWKLLYWIRNLFIPLLLAALFALMYRYLSSKYLPFSICIVAGMICSGCWFLFSQIFSVYLHVFRRNNTIWSVLTMAMLWLYFCLSIILYAGLLSKLIWKKEYHPIKIIKDTFF